MSDGLSFRYRGRRVPGLGDEWAIDSVAYRSLVFGDTVETCEQTGEKIPPETGHLYVTARGKTGFRRDEFKHFVLRDEDALREWLDE